MDQLISNGKVRRGKLGVIVDPVDPEIARQFGYKGVDGAFVQDVEKGQPADLAGVRAGDIITEFQGVPIKERDQLRNLASSTQPGTSVKFKIWREGSERELTAKLAEVTLARAPDQPGENESASGSNLLSGVRVDNITPDLAQRLNLASSIRGVIVMEVDPETAERDQHRRIQ